jgi:tetratricopeptide (TPR) repeat protein
MSDVAGSGNMQSQLLSRYLINRSRIIILFSCLLLVISCLSKWYNLPTEILDYFNAHLQIIGVEKIAVIVVLILAGPLLFCGRNTGILRLASMLSFIFVLLLPYFISVWNPKVSYIAESFYRQQRDINRHIEVNYSLVQDDWKRDIILRSSRPIRSTNLFSIQDGQFFQLPHWEEFAVIGAGFTLEFFTFIGRGWVFAILGLVGILFTTYCLDLPQEQSLQELAKAGQWLCLLVFCFIVFQLTPQFINFRVDTLYAQGKYLDVVRMSKFLEKIYPSFTNEERFIERNAKSKLYVSNSENLDQLYLLQGIERFRKRDFQRAAQFFAKAIELNPDLTTIRGYLASCLINQGVRSYNDQKSRLTTSAEIYFDQALKIFPAHLEALYNLMLVRAIDGNFEDSSKAARFLLFMQQYFQTPGLPLINQAYLYLAGKELQLGDLNTAWIKYRNAIDSKSWRQLTKDISDSNQLPIGRLMRDFFLSSQGSESYFHGLAENIHQEDSESYLLSDENWNDRYDKETAISLEPDDLTEAEDFDPYEQIFLQPVNEESVTPEPILSSRNKLLTYQTGSDIQSDSEHSAFNQNNLNAANDPSGESVENPQILENHRIELRHQTNHYNYESLDSPPLSSDSDPLLEEN